MKNYLVWCPEYDQERSEARRISAYDEGQAAEAWAEEYDSRHGEYEIVKGNYVTVMVAEAEEGSEPIAYIVAGEAEPTYYARKVP